MLIEIYREDSEKRDWRWRMVATNGKIVADGGEGYKKRSGCKAAVDRVKRDLPGARVVEIMS